MKHRYRRSYILLRLFIYFLFIICSRISANGTQPNVVTCWEWGKFQNVHVQNLGCPLL